MTENHPDELPARPDPNAELRAEVFKRTAGVGHERMLVSLAEWNKLVATRLAKKDDEARARGTDPELIVKLRLSWRQEIERELRREGIFPQT
jgi:hypothetical protein